MNQALQTFKDFSLSSMTDWDFAELVRELQSMKENCTLPAGSRFAEIRSSVIEPAVGKASATPLLEEMVKSEAMRRFESLHRFASAEPDQNSWT